MRSNERRFSLAAAPDDGCGPARAFSAPAAVQKFFLFSFAGAKESPRNRAGAECTFIALNGG